MRLNTKIKSKKLFKFLLITFCVIPVIFFQSSCSKNSDNDAFEREIDTLKKKISNLELINNGFSLQLKPFNDLMIKYNVNNCKDLMKKLIDPNDLDLQEKSLSLANCLLKTKTLKIEKLKQNLADTQ